MVQFVDAYRADWGVGPICREIQKVYDDNFQLYGARKVWHALKRSSVSVAHCAVAHLMWAYGLEGVRRGKPWKTTIPDDAADRPLDFVDHHFKAEAPNCLWIAGRLP